MTFPPTEPVLYKHILAARRTSWADLTEKSLGRVYQHIQASGKKSYGVVTSWRQDLDAETNKRNFEALKKHIRSLGLGFTTLEGHYREKGQKETTPEPSLFIPGISKEQVTALGNKYNQDSVLYSGPETHASHPSQRQDEDPADVKLSPDQYFAKHHKCPPGYHHKNNACAKEAARVHMINRDGSHMDLGEFHPDRISGYYSRVKGHTFKFEGLDYPIQGTLDGLATEVDERQGLRTDIEQLRALVGP